MDIEKTTTASVKPEKSVFEHLGRWWQAPPSSASPCSEAAAIEQPCRSIQDSVLVSVPKRLSKLSVQALHMSVGKPIKPGNGCFDPFADRCAPKGNAKVWRR